MKFRTELNIRPLERKIDHSQRGMALGSCFAENIAGRMRRAKFALTSNPEGVLYNPFSIADALESENLRPTIESANYLIISFGTAWVYELDGRVVANCGRRPAHLFTRRRLSVGEIVERYNKLIDSDLLRGKQLIFTVSPIRHLKDGFEENSLSKATLRVAVDEIIAASRNAETAAGNRPQNTPQGTDIQYFPAYEILTDDLRDYRFYATDLTHPSEMAVDYIWQKFQEFAFEKEPTGELISRLEALAKAIEHRPFDPDGDEYRGFGRKMALAAQELQREHSALDLSAEIDFFCSVAGEKSSENRETAGKNPEAANKNLKTAGEKSNENH